MLDGLRVLDLTQEPGFLAGKILGDMGADVVKVEPPGGDLEGRRGPYLGGVEDPERSLAWLALNTSKRGITLDLEGERGREVFRELADSNVFACARRLISAGVDPFEGTVMNRIREQASWARPSSDGGLATEQEFKDFFDFCDKHRKPLPIEEIRRRRQRK